MTPTDHLDGQIRRALQELGDAVGVPPTYADVVGTDVIERDGLLPQGRWVRSADRGSSPSREAGQRGSTVLTLGTQRPRRRRAGWLVPAAVMVAALTAGVVANRSSDPRGVDPTDTATAVPVPSGVPTTAPAPITPSPPASTALGAMVGPLLPDGFQLTYATADPLLAVAFDGNRVRLTVAITLNGRDGALREDFQASDWHAVPQGQATVDGQRIITTAGDVVTVWADYGPNLRELPIVEAARAELAEMAARLADALVEPARSELAAITGMQLGAGELETGAAARLAEATGQLVALRGGGASGWVQVAVQPADAEGPTAETREWTNLTALYTATALDESVVRPDPRTATATRWVNGWQLVLSTIGPNGGATTYSDDQLVQLLEEVQPAFAAWSPAAIDEPTCGAHVTASGDSEAAVAERYGLTAERLAAVNPDSDAANGRSPYRWNLPCDGVPQVRSADHSALAGYVGEPAAGFVEHNRVTVASDRRVWIVAAGSDTREGQPAIAIWTFDRDTGETLATLTAGLRPEQCGGPVEIVDDLAAPLEAIPIRCTADGAMATVDVFTGQASDFGRYSGISAEGG